MHMFVTQRLQILLCLMRRLHHGDAALVDRHLAVLYVYEVIDGRSPDVVHKDVP